MFLHYSQYLGRNDFYQNRFSEPTPSLSDPTEKGQFSNIAGKAIADFLSKRIDQAIITVNYEAALRADDIPVIGRRPDLLAYTNHGRFAIEAKGFSSAYPGNMQEHKAQASAGHMRVNYSVAAVSFNLFRRVRCNYHDPYNDSVPFDLEGLRAVSKEYYEGLAGFLADDAFRYTEATHQGEKFIEVDITRPIRYALGREWWPPFPELFEAFWIRLVLPGSIRDYAKEGLSADSKPFVMNEGSEREGIYIDYDRVGLRLTPWR